MFVEVTREKLIGEGAFCSPILNRVKFKRDGKFYVIFDVSVLKVLIIINFSCIVNFISLIMHPIIFMSMILTSK